MANKFFMDLLNKIPKRISNFNSLSMGIAAYIDDVLKSRRMNQGDLAKLLGKKDSQISKWLGGQHNFTIETIANIEAVLDIQIIRIPIYREDEIAFGKKPFEAQFRIDPEKMVRIDKLHPVGVSNSQKSTVTVNLNDWRKLVHAGY